MAGVMTTSRIFFIRTTPLRDDGNERNSGLAKPPERHGNSPSVFPPFVSIIPVADGNARQERAASGGMCGSEPTPWPRNSRPGLQALEGHKLISTL